MSSVTQSVTSEGRRLGGGTLYSAGYNVSAGLAGGISAGRSMVINAVAALCASAVAEARSRLEIHSPSKVFEQLGSYTAEGFGEGYEKKIGDVNRMIRDSMDYSGYKGLAGSEGIGAAGVSGGEDIVQMLREYLPYLVNVGKEQVYLYPNRRSFRNEISEIANDGLGTIYARERMR